VVPGKRLDNETTASAGFIASAALTLRGSYCWQYLDFFDAGARETAHSIEFAGAYRRWQQHRMRARYTLSILQLSDGRQSLVHDFEVGDDYLRLHEIRLTPTLTLSLAGGVMLLTTGEGGGQTGSGGSHGSKFRLENKFDARLTKVWEASLLEIGARRGLTTSFGISGPSFTTSFFGHFTTTFTRRLHGSIEAGYSLYDTGDAKFATLDSFATLQYRLTKWLSAGLVYTYRRLDPRAGATGRDFLSHGVTSGQSVLVGFTVTFDIWPDVRLTQQANNPLQEPGMTPPSLGLIYPGIP
jgi:hypothetical protein